MIAFPVMAEGIVKDSSLAIFLDKQQRFRAFAPIGIGGNERMDFPFPLQFGVEFVVDVEIFQSFCDRMIVIGDIGGENTAWTVTGCFPSPISVHTNSRILPIL